MKKSRIALQFGIIVLVGTIINRYMPNPLDTIQMFSIFMCVGMLDVIYLLEKMSKK